MQDSDAASSDVRQFDLNVETVLENWSMAHAIREIIANALDEHILSKTANPEISKDDNGAWHIRDFGRGLRYEHLTQNENQEKLRAAGQIIGRFGVGLKDALATADRRRVRILIRSKYGIITTGKAGKHGFENVQTLHAEIRAPTDTSMVGTDFMLEGVTDEDMAQAKAFFLRYSQDEQLEVTGHGIVLKKEGATARIYVNGLRVAEEENFLFSYNITSTTASLNKALNRERTHVGRTAYTERVKSILLGSIGSAVASGLADDLAGFATGKVHDEVGWTEVALHACKVLNSNEKVIFVTSEQLLAGGSLVGHAQGDGCRVVVVPQNIALKLSDVTDLKGEPIRDLGQYRQEWDSSFEFKFVNPIELTAKEQHVFAFTRALLQLAGKERTRRVKEVLISETMRLESDGQDEAVGCWEGGKGRIVIKRSELKEVESFASTVLHEVTHACTGADDLTQEFEDGLSQLLGTVAKSTLVPK